jgi:glucokinase
MKRFSIGVDLGGTNLRAAAVTPEGDVLEDFAIPTEASDGPDRVVERMVEGIREVREGHSGKELIGIGVGVPGLVRLDSGVIAQAPNLPGWENFPLKERLEASLELPVIVENDANAAALGEVWLGAGKDVDSLILLTLGTGIGGGIISRDRIVRGADGMAGELGHMTVDPHSKNVCSCGNVGCLEAEASGTAIRKMGTAAAKSGESFRLRALLEEEGSVTPLLVAQAADAGDETARAIFVHMGEALGVGLASLINAFNFPLYLLGGGVLASWDLFAPAMMAEIEKRSITYRATHTRIEKAGLGSKAGIFGAAYFPIQGS